MNSRYINYLTVANTVLDGSVLTTIDGNPGRWVCAHAHEDATFEITSDTMFNDAGAPLTAELIEVAAGAYYYMYATKIKHISGKVSYYKEEAA